MEYTYQYLTRPETAFTLLPCHDCTLLIGSHGDSLYFFLQHGQQISPDFVPADICAVERRDRFKGERSLAGQTPPDAWAAVRG
jgi:hypothetical protein